MLQLLKNKAESDFTLTAEVTNLSTLDLEADSTILTKLYPSEYEHLSALQKTVVLTVGLFEQDITFKALYEVRYPDMNLLLFCFIKVCTVIVTSFRPMSCLIQVPQNLYQEQ